ncbi:MAG: glycine cleavage system aminomethyltransferase GcvT, partial [Proteobacteria bacterium]|nr:glycine cleavage system aminomethyltransferase GcvT [Pseudomonadota bacterium]
KDAEVFLYRLLANDVKKLNCFQAMYSTMLNTDGGIIDDLIVYKLSDHNSENHYRVVVNAATRKKDLAWFSQQIVSFDAVMQEQDQLAMVAVQGPDAIAACDKVLPIDLDGLKRFYACCEGELFVGRTGYTGEDGVEIIIPSQHAEKLWDDLLAAGVKPAGLGARDTLRLEAGMHLYGQDMHEEISPLECGLGWTIRKDNNDFIGADALKKIREKGINKKLIGLVLETRGILRHDQQLEDAQGNTGIISSGGYSPSTEKAIAMAIVDKGMNDSIVVKIRNKSLPCKKVKLPFVRNGKSLIED